MTKWKSKGLLNESLEVVSKTGNTLTPSVSYYGDKVRLRFTGSVLQQKIVTQLLTVIKELWTFV